jgi:hypothetical protein
MDYFNLLKIIKSLLLKIGNTMPYTSVQFFRCRCQKKQIWLTDGASNLEELASKTKAYFRRLKLSFRYAWQSNYTYIKIITKELILYDKLWDDSIEEKKITRWNQNAKDLIRLILLRQYIASISIPYTYRYHWKCDWNGSVKQSYYVY